MPFKLVVAFDGSAAARQALHVALQLAGALDPHAELHVVSVVDYISLPLGLTEAPAAAPDLLASDAETELRVAEEIAAAAGQPITTRMLRGAVAPEVLTYARNIGASLIIVGTHGRKGIIRAVAGSTCESLVRESEIPVMSVHAVSCNGRIKARSEQNRTHTTNA
jgi:nucleotide-binding universal stress UspA family protein